MCIKVDVVVVIIYLRILIDFELKQNCDEDTLGNF